ncbi:MAG TPA: hypothetical protein VFO73_09800, partial [Candidatus Limnocylindrales bacterium]|nr:hypothetical protein [Candidatus Limnocylindrales bacterium]
MCLLIVVAALGPLTASALAHGEVPAEPPTIAGLVFGWSFDPALVLPLLVLTGGWIALVRRVNATHPATPVPARRSLAFLA